MFKKLQLMAANIGLYIFIHQTGSKINKTNKYSNLKKNKKNNENLTNLQVPRIIREICMDKCLRQNS